ncbi:MAG: ABC transporter substrate-binding protein [Eubacteriaceae bacterium]|nr:ABC transporter substrate-binding protein [Eubacteriaceae bacterium]
MKKNGFKKMTALVMAILMIALVATGCGGGSSNEKESDAADKVYKVGLVQFVEHEALDQANKGMVDGLKAEGLEVGKNLEIDQQNAQADQANLKNIADRFVGNQVDLICAIATPAAQTMANATSDIPIVGTAITDYVEAKLAESNEKPGSNVTGTTDMNPVEEQVDLLLELAPEAKSIGVIYTSSEINSQIQADRVKTYATSKGINVEEVTISNVNDMQQAAQSLIGKVDAVYVPTDNNVASSMPILADITRENNLPVVSGEEGPVRAGATATIGISYYELGKQAGIMAAKILKGEATPADMPIEEQKTYTTVINKKEADAIGLTIPQAILDNADEVLE